MKDVMKLLGIEVTAEEQRIIICAIGGFQLDDEERKTIRPFYLRLLNAHQPGIVRPEVMASLESPRVVGITPSLESPSLVGIAPTVMPLSEVRFYKEVCSTCHDTHRMDLNGDTVNCTRCPHPCGICRIGGLGAYCAVTPCSCSCHDRDLDVRCKAALRTIGGVSRAAPLPKYVDALVTDYPTLTVAEFLNRALSEDK